MCGRFTLRTSPAEIAEIFALLREPELVPRYNIAPTQQVAAIRPAGGGRELSMLAWGLVPAWSKSPKGGPPLINARGESVATKPSFRDAFRKRRCLIPADGFYEWKKTGPRSKQPYYIRVRGGRPFAFAGLWEHWEAADGAALDSCTIITTDANEALRDLHDRMPVILPPDSYDEWLDPNAANPAELERLLVPYPAAEMDFYPIRTTVNNARNETPACIERQEESTEEHSTEGNKGNRGLF
jgi:putative SOS response-associated peptidase YedK